MLCCALETRCRSGLACICALRLFASCTNCVNTCWRPCPSLQLYLCTTAMLSAPARTLARCLRHASYN